MMKVRAFAVAGGKEPFRPFEYELPSANALCAQRADEHSLLFRVGKRSET